MPVSARQAVGVAALALLILTGCSPASEVYVVGSDGSNPLRVARGTLGALSHDGSQVLFSRDGEIAVATRDRGIRLLTRRPFYDASPSWSPDGGRVAFSRDTTTRHGPHEAYVHVMNADGTAVRALTAGPSSDQAPVWSPDGTRLAFLRESDVYVVNADGSAPRRVGHGARPESRPTWSRDGGRLAFAWSESAAGAPATSGIAVADAAGLGVVRITQTWFDANAYQSGDDSPDWSPDGARIAFSRQGAVHAVNPDGSGLTQLGTRGYDPRWAPDGKRIVFCCAGRKAYDDGIFTMGPDGSGMRRLHQQGYSPTWSGDGTLIAFEKLR